VLPAARGDERARRRIREPAMAHHAHAHHRGPP
jgi:hypothetical protein